MPSRSPTGQDRAVDAWIADRPIQFHVGWKGTARLLKEIPELRQVVAIIGAGIRHGGSLNLNCVAPASSARIILSVTRLRVSKARTNAHPETVSMQQGVAAVVPLSCDILAEPEG